MKPQALHRAAVRLYGDRGWQSALAGALKVDVSTVRRWVSGAVPIPTAVELAVRYLLKESGK